MNDVTEKDFALAVPGEVKIHTLDQLGLKGTKFTAEMLMFPPKDIFVYDRKTTTIEYLQNIAIFLVSHKRKAFNFFRKPIGEDAEWQFVSAGLIYLKEKPNGLILIVHNLKDIFEGGEKINKLLSGKMFTPSNFNACSSLTKREKEIIKHTINGKKSSEIANLLFISKNTVDTHRRNINKKLQIKSRVELLNVGRNFDFA